MYPHERSLVEKLKDAPFALLGVNSDRDLDKLAGRIADERITWRSFWNGPSGPPGAIARNWGVRGWPTIYVLDHEGVIRAKNKRGQAMETAVEQLLGEMPDRRR